MGFPDGSTRAGHFEENVFKAVVKSIEEIEPVRDQLGQQCIQEIEKFLERRLK
jgi:hypothetical protein